MTADYAHDEAPPGAFARVRGLALTPQSEWARIAAEVPSPSTFVLPLAVAGAAAGAGAAYLARGAPTLASALWIGVAAALHVLVALLLVRATAWFANVWAERFGGARDDAKAWRLAGFAATAMLLAGLSVLAPVVSPLLLLAGAIYSVVLFGLGAPAMLGVTAARAPIYALSVLASLVALLIVGAAVINPWIARGRDALNTRFAPHVATSDARTESPPASEVERALNGSLYTYARRRPPAPERLAEQLPLTLPGGLVLQQTSSGADGGLSQARADYANGAAQLSVTIVHLGGLADVPATARRLDVGDDAGDGYTRRQAIDGRVFVEQMGDDMVRYIVVGRGLAVRVEGAGGVTVDQARAAIDTIGLRRLEEMYGG